MKRKKDHSELIGLLIIIAIVIIALVISVGGAYLISVSDLPDWFKFWLLSNRS